MARKFYANDFSQASIYFFKISLNCNPPLEMLSQAMLWIIPGDPFIFRDGCIRGPALETLFSPMLMFVSRNILC